MKDGGLTRKPIPGLIKSLAVPATIGIFFNTMYNVVDTYFGGLISTDALAALSLSFPVFFLIIALGAGISTGTAALIGNSLGAGKKKKARLYATQSIVFAFIIGILLSFLGLYFAPFLFKTLGASGEYLQIALEYINVIFYGAVFFMLNNIFNAMLFSQGDSKTYRNFLIVGFLLNLILDPWFLFGGLGIPALGLKGIALATVIIQFIGTLYLGYKVLQTKLICPECKDMLKPKKKIFKDLSVQGFPASLSMTTVALGIFIITFFIKNFGKEAVAAYGIATRIEQIALLPIIGLNVATRSLIAQNNGARKFKRVKEIFRTVLKYGFFVMLVGWIFIFFFARTLMGWFTDNMEVIGIGSVYLKIAAFLLWFYMLIFMSVASLQAMKRPMFAVWSGIARQIVAPLILFPLFAYKFGWGLIGIWIGIIIMIVGTALVSIVYISSVLKRLPAK